MGPPHGPAGLDLGTLGVVLTKNGCVVETAAGAAVMGHPAASVAWLARSLHQQGESGPRRGELIMSGGLTAAVPIGPGDTVTVEIAQLGRLTLPVT